MVVSAPLGAGVAGAQSGGGDTAKNLRVTTKQVERSIRRKARLVGEAQPAVFPNAYVKSSYVYVNCMRAGGSMRHRPMWACGYSIYLNDTSRSDPSQFTIRDCSTPESPPARLRKNIYATSRLLYLRRARSSRKLRIIGGWRMSCPVNEWTISQWTESGGGYQPNVTEPSPYKLIKPLSAPPRPRGDLLSPPSGEPAGPPPGPISTDGGARSSSTARSSTHIRYGCGYWQAYWVDPRYRVYPCFWGLDVPPFGAGLGIFNQSSYYYEWYYWVGNDNAGNPVSRLFLSGTM
jgi:hypothetical protein